MINTEKTIDGQLLISELIIELEKAKQKYGDVPMYFYVRDERVPLEVETVEVQGTGKNGLPQYLIIK